MKNNTLTINYKGKRYVFNKNRFKSNVFGLISYLALESLFMYLLFNLNNVITIGQHLAK